MKIKCFFLITPKFFGPLNFIHGSLAKNTCFIAKDQEINIKFKLQQVRKEKDDPDEV